MRRSTDAKNRSADAGSSVREGEKCASCAQDAWRAIERVPNNRTPNGREVRADLVLAPVGARLDQSAALQPRNHAQWSALAALVRAQSCGCGPRIAGNGQR